MAEHGDNYIRLKGEKGNEIGVLGIDCGHHCGAITVGHAESQEHHCTCPQCHNSNGRSTRRTTHER